MRRTWAVMAMVGLMAASLAGCGATSNSAGGKSASSTTVLATTAPSTAPASTTIASAPTATVGDQLAKLLVVPTGFVASTSPDVTNGPLDTAAFDKQAGQAGAASILGFAGGYDQTYDQVSGNDYVEVLVMQFSTPVQASSFTKLLLANKPAGSTTSTLTEIPGAVAINGPHPNGTYDHGVAASKGTRILAIDYTSATSAPVKQLVSIAVNQYRTI